MRNQHARSKAVILAAILVLVFVVIYSGLQILESTFLVRKNSDQAAVSSKTVSYNGKQYFPRQDITVFLIMGIDEEGPVKDSGSYRNSGEADVDLVVIFDDAKKTFSILNLNRDTMLPVQMLGLGGKKAGSAIGQLALAHTYGSGLEDSAVNTRETVSSFLKGIQIDYYLAVNMDAISILNDAVGGVTVEVTDDFSDVDASIPMGSVKLTGDQAYHFIRSRKSVGNQLNVSRMERHKAYLEGFVKALDAKLEAGDSFVLSTHEEIEPYSVTDCSVNTLTSLLNRFRDYELDEIVSPEGTNTKGENYMEFYVDEAKLEELTIRLFFAEK